jgi:hypothetical protein
MEDNIKMAKKGVHRSVETEFKKGHKGLKIAKGEIYIDEHGYTRKYINGKKIRMHRLIWEQYNCKIPEGYDVHHINGIKTDNRIENLQLIKHGEHSSKHRIKEYKERYG